MKKPQTDYRKFRFHNLNTPEFSHLKLLLGWVVYFTLYVLTESLIPPERCHVVHCALDDRIPFREEFVIFYVGWYFLILFSLGYFLLYSVDSFRKLQTYFILIQLVAMAVYLLWPSRQELRPQVFPRENLLTAVVGLLYRIDTPTGVCPSVHVAGSVAIASVWLRERRAKPWQKAAIGCFCLLVCLSVSFLKQHSVVDILAAIPLCLLGEWFVFFRKRA